MNDKSEFPGKIRRNKFFGFEILDEVKYAVN